MPRLLALPPSLPFAALAALSCVLASGLAPPMRTWGPSTRLRTWGPSTRFRFFTPWACAAPPPPPGCAGGIPDLRAPATSGLRGWAFPVGSRPEAASACDGLAPVSAAHLPRGPAPLSAPSSPAKVSAGWGGGRGSSRRFLNTKAALRAGPHTQDTQEGPQRHERLWSLHHTACTIEGGASKGHARGAVGSAASVALYPAAAFA